MIDTSPFRPGQTAPVELFVGRNEEVARLRQLVSASSKGRLTVGFVSGERGIGKSSVAAFVRRLVEREHHAIGSHVLLGGAADVRELLRRTLVRIVNDGIDRPWYGKLVEFLENRIEKVGLFGMSLTLRLTDDDLSGLELAFVPAMSRLVDSLPKPGRTLFLIFDDVNGLARSDNFANWLKSTVDEFATSAPGTRLCLLFVGLEEVRREMVKRQPSLARVFDLIEIKPWSDHEASEFYERSFREGGARISPDGVSLLVEYTGGLPVLAHEIGDAVWRMAAASQIRPSDVRGGILLAADVIGTKLLEPRVFSAIQSERYRSILRQIADRPRMHFRRADVIRRLPESDKKGLDPFLRRMKALRALEEDPEIRGGYRFPNRLHALYFFMESQRHHHRARTR